MSTGKTVIFGCGNLFCGDDGFGPAVIAALQKESLPPGVRCIDAATSIRDHLFDYLLDESLRPEQVIIVDAVHLPDRNPGAVFLLDIDELPKNKQHDFSLHQFPAVNMLGELQDVTAMNVTIVAGQTAQEPNTFSQGLSESMQEAVPAACRMIKALLLNLQEK